jgi:hypothetical protein
MFRPLAAIATAIAACAGVLAALAAPGESLSTTPGPAVAPQHVAGVFVSLGTDANGTLIAIDQGGTVRALRVAASAAVTEAESGAAAPTGASLIALKAGEPVDLQLASDGSVTAIVARYTSVATRVTASQNGYVVAADGNAYKLVGTALAAAPSLDVGTYVLMRTDPATGNAFDLVASRQSFRTTAQSTVVAVTFVVHVPANTPPTDAIYLATNAGNWTPNGTRLVPLDGGRWTGTLSLAAGTQIEYRYTRGSWATDERTASGTPTANRTLTAAKTAGTQSVEDVVARWADLAS